jgi:flavin reductase (DIM6/NTAB) family NADH-FMN oxidoreductase RutF
MREAIEAKAFRALSYGLYIVTSVCGEKANGQIANSVIQVTSAPPQIAVCINRENLTHACILESGVFGVSILGENTPLSFIGRFGFKSGRNIDKLSGVDCLVEGHACPLVTENAVAVMTAKVVKQLAISTHTLFVGEVTYAAVLNAELPLSYATYHEIKRGKTPKKAPTYQV